MAKVKAQARFKVQAGKFWRWATPVVTPIQEKHLPSFKPHRLEERYSKNFGKNCEIAKNQFLRLSSRPPRDSTSVNLALVLTRPLEDMHCFMKIFMMLLVDVLWVH